jgi:hypothetical protein
LGLCAAASSVLTLADRVDHDRCGAPAALVVITHTGYAYRRPDGCAWCRQGRWGCERDGQGVRLLRGTPLPPGWRQSPHTAPQGRCPRIARVRVPTHPLCPPVPTRAAAMTLRQK